MSVYRPRLQRRLMLTLVGYTLFVGVLLGALAMAFVYAVEDEFFATTLRAEAQRQQAHRDAQDSWVQPALPFVRLYPAGAGLPADLARALARRTRGQEFEGDEGRHYHLRRLDADGSLLVAEVSQQLVVRPMRNTLLVWLGACGVGFTLLALLLAGVVARRTSAPLARLAHQVAHSRPDALPDGLAAGLVHDEVGELAHHLDALHARTRELVQREQTFTADASHELRTPLTVLGVACERLLQQAPVASRPLVMSMQAAVWQLQQSVALLLELARETPTADASAPEQPLLPMMEQLLLAHAPWLDQQNVQVELDLPARLTRPWPPSLTHLLLGNLLANAVAHAQSPHIRIEADAVRLCICNASAPPPAALLATHAAGRTQGLKGSGSRGRGLGLSIARRLAERHGLVLELSHHDGRTCATLRSA
jgi:signal transduction histidine kinase